MAIATVILFAKFQLRGKVETRLISALGADGAAQLAEAFLLDLTERLARNLDRTIDCVLCFDPADAEDEFHRLLASIPSVLERFEFLPQSTGDLGARLASALARVRESHAAPYIFIGTD